MQSIVFELRLLWIWARPVRQMADCDHRAGGLVFYAVQVAMSRVWLRHFRFGPVEWVWRALSYGKLQPFRKEAKVAVATAEAGS